MRLAAKLSFVSFLAMGLAQFCAAQQVGSRDLTQSWQPPNDHLPSPLSAACPTVNSTISPGSQMPGATPKAIDDKALEFTIAELAPPELHIGEDFTATVRLKNIGSAEILVPWQPDGERVVRVSPDGKEEMYEVADVTFRLKTGAKHRAPMFLESAGALFAHPDDEASYVKLDPGRWVDVKLKGVLTCGLPECPDDAVPDDHAVLTAWWYQRILTHKVEGCSEDHGSSVVRQLDSAPRSIVVLAPSSSTSESPSH
jgi:hypothetical protein